MKLYLVITISLSFIVFNIDVSGVTVEEYNCGACLALVDEIIHEIKQVDPKKLLDVGSFRIDPNGNQKLKQIPYAKSETHLYEVLENVCSRLNNYGSAIEKERSYFLRRVDYKNFVFSGYLEVNNPEKLVNYCHTLLEDSEEDVIETFKSDGDDYHEKLCLDTLDFCSAQNITDFEDMKNKAVYLESSPHTSAEHGSEEESSEDADENDNGEDGDDDQIKNGKEEL